MAERVLVRAPNWIGDSVLSLGFLSALRKLRPGADITVMAHARAADIFRGHPSVDGLISFAKSDSILSMLRRAGRRDFNECYLLPLSLSSAVVAFLAGIPRRIGYAAEGRGFLLTESLSYDRVSFRSRHLLEGYCRLLGDGAAPGFPLIHLSSPETDEAASWLERKGLAGRVAGFGPGATYGTAKRWPPERWVELGRMMAGAGWGVLVFGSAEEAGLCGEIADRIGQGAASCAGQAGLRASVALMSRCSLFVSNDTGAMHLAAASGTRVVAIFGSTSPVWTGPWGEGHKVLYTGEPCSPCYRRTCRFGHYRCLESITADGVAEAIDKAVKIR